MTEERKQMRTFGIGLVVIGAIASGLSFFWKDNPSTAAILLAIFGTIGLTHLLLPAVALPFFRAWMKFATGMAWFNTRLLLILFFYLILVPVGLVMKIIGRDALNRKMSRDAETYWEDRDSRLEEHDHFEHQF